MRHRWHLRHAGPSRAGSRPAAPHEPRPAPSRSGRGRGAFRTGPGVRPPPPVDHRPFVRPAAAGERGRVRAGGVQRRDLQLPVAGRRAVRTRTHVPHPLGHRGHRPCLGRVGCGLRAALQRHVRVRALGPQPADPVSRPRPSRQEAAVLHRHCGRSTAVRLRAEVAARGTEPGAPARSARGRGISRFRLRARSAIDPGGRAQARARQPAAVASRTALGPAEGILERILRARRGAVRGRARGGGGGKTARGDAHPPDVGGTARRVPLRGRGLERSGGDDGGLVARSGKDLLDFVRRQRVRRVGVCRPRGGAVPHRPLRAQGRHGRLRAARYPGGSLRRAVRRQLGHSHLPRLPARAYAGSRSRYRGTAATKLSPATAATSGS